MAKVVAAVAASALVVTGWLWRSGYAATVVGGARLWVAATGLVDPCNEADYPA